ncbi:MAG TPA: SdrD B-like domain-containing protein [Ramlibacter sp.]|nr:SdrD B-like domain-containing protein [Ramlibacter sp.]
MDRTQAEQERLRAMIQAAPPAYEDRFMNADAAPGAASDASAEALAEDPGFRAWSLESRAGFGQSSGTGFGRQRAAEFGVRAEYRRETLNYGEFMLQLDARHLSGDEFTDLGGIGGLGYAKEPTSDRFTLRNLGFPLTPQTFADTSVGDIYSELTDGLGRNYRLSLGTSNVRGLSTRIFNADYDLRAGTGERGYLAGGPYPGFEKSQGSLSWLGATRRINDEWIVAGQVDRATDVPAYYTSIFTTEGFGAKDVSSWAASVGYIPKSLLEAGAFKLRTTVVGSSVASSTPGVPTGSAQGLYVEASVRTGRFNHEVGAYTAKPNLYFGDYALATGTRGAYWRIDHSASRMNWGGGLDYERAAPDTLFNLFGYTRAGASGNFQYLLGRESSFGGNLNVYQTRYDNAAVGSIAGDSRSIYGNAFYQTRFFDLPRTRLSLTVQRNEQIVLLGTAATGQELQWEQDWINGRYEAMRPELTTTIGYARDQSGGATRIYPTAGVQFRYWIGSGFSVMGNLRYTSQDGDLYTSRGLSGALSAEKELAPGWRIGVAANMNQARSAAIQTPLFGPQVYRSNDKTAYVYLRWDGSAGTAYQTAGGRSGAGGGSVSGRVFFDANRDGRQQVGENGVANVELLLDGRYRTTTDRDGRFEFPLVTTGRHQLTLTLDSVPLPWGAAEDGGVSVNVPLRGQANAEIPVIKVGE